MNTEGINKKQYRGVNFWTMDTSTGPWEVAFNGYIELYIPNVTKARDVTALFTKNGGEASLPNGDRFTYLSRGGGKKVAGFDGLHSFNIREPLTKVEAERQAMVAIDFLLDNALGFVFPPRGMAHKAL